uniref:ABC transporter substrate-binding protein n=1 Tax=Thermosporothrix sp. COM3 TaxID=2490863 RepID=A0A455SAE1_9CHLR|nr:ABC transporter substrate-binding protein [Thermosporothrix sp. COM3]
MNSGQQYVHMKRDERRLFTRRRFLGQTAALGLGSGLLVPLLSSCGLSGGGTAAITFWNLFGGGDGERMVQMQNVFKQQHPEVQLEAVTLQWGGPYYTKLAMAAAGGRAPDVGIIHMSRLATFAAGGLIDPFDPAELAKYGITNDSFLPPVWANAHRNQKLYAIPLDTHPLVMFYNTDICGKAGLLDGNGRLKQLQGPEQMMDAIRAVKKVTGKYGLVMEAVGVNPWRLFVALYSQLGGQIFSPDGTELILDNAKAEQVVEFLTEVVAEGAYPSIDAAAAVAYFSNQKAGLLWNGEWEVTTFQNQKIPFDATLFPNIFGNYHTWADSHAFVLPHQMAPDPQRRAASLLFISTMLKNSLIWAQGGHIPAYLGVANSAEYKNLVPQAHYADAAANLVLDPPAWFSGAASDMENQAGAAFAAAMAKQLTPKQGVQQFRRSMEKLLRVPRPF